MTVDAIRLVALDIDGTLLEPGVDPRDMPGDAMTTAIKRMQERGIIVVLASGRMFPGTVSVAEHLDVDQPLICQQGASVHNRDGSLLYGFSIDKNIALELVEYANRDDWPVAWFDSERYLVSRPCEEAEFFAKASGISMEVHETPHRSGVRPTGIDIISNRQQASLIHAEIEQRYGDRLHVLDFPSVTAVHAPGASKGNALKILSQNLGIDQMETLAIGDSVNDVSMLLWAGHSAAPEHSDEFARKSAKETLKGRGVEGVVAKLNGVVG